MARLKLCLPQSDFGACYVLAAPGEFNKQLFKKSKTLQKRSLLR